MIAKEDSRREKVVSLLAESHRDQNQSRAHHGESELCDGISSLAVDMTRRFYASEGPAARKGLHCLGPAEARLISHFLNLKSRFTVPSKSAESRRNTAHPIDWLGEVLLDEEPRPDNVTAVVNPRLTQTSVGLTPH